MNIILNYRNPQNFWEYLGIKKVAYCPRVLIVLIMGNNTILKLL